MTTVSFKVLDSVVDYSQITREQLLAAREYVLMVKRTARQGGFGEVAGRMIRETVGYKFDSMDIIRALDAMGAADFLARYGAKLATWYAGLSQSAAESTLKGNAAKHTAALALVNDADSFRTLVKALRILCERNQSWQESGAYVSLPYNGHKAILDLFGINVTNARRIALSTN